MDPTVVKWPYAILYRMTTDSWMCYGTSQPLTYDEWINFVHKMLPGWEHMGVSPTRTKIDEFRSRR